MPIIKSAKKRMRQDFKRTRRNKSLKQALKKTIKVAKKTKKAESLSSAFSIIDKTAKKGVVHKNKTARLKSRLSKLTTTSSKKQKKIAQIK